MRAVVIARASFALLLTLASGCVHARDFRSPHERITEDSAYAETRRVRIDTNLLSPDSQQFAADVGVTVAAVRRRLDFGVNVLHGAVGVANLQSKFTFYDGRWYAIGGRVAFSYLNPSTLWMLPAQLREPLGHFNLMTAPFELWQSFPFTRWFGLNVALSYRASGIWGSFDKDSVIADASFAQRAWAIEPVIDVFVVGRVAFRARARLPLTARFAEATEATYELEPGVKLGVTSVEWMRRDFSKNVQLAFSAETRFGANTHVRLSVNVWAFRPLPYLAVVPSLSLYWRFR